ncbi:MAG: alpha/beta fold hydrolase [Burkholderiaceae bacterium]
MSKPAPPFRRGYADTARGQLHYLEAGSGDETLVLLHATSRSSRCYRRMLPLLAQRFHVLAPDFPGFGGSHPIDDIGSIEDLAQVIVEFLDLRGLQRVHLFGLHLGNKVGAALAARWPARVKDLILMGQTHSLIVDRRRRDAEIGRLSRHHYPPDTASSNGLELLQAWAGVNATIQAQWWTRPLLKNARIDADDVDNARARLIDYLTGQPSLEKLYPLVHAFDMTEAYRKVQARTLLIELLTAEEMHLGAQAPQMAALMQRAEHAALQEADNMVLEFRPQEVSELILRFLNGSTSGSA